jgi:hypothetical protein
MGSVSDRASMWAQRENPKLARTLRFISVLDPLGQQVAGLNERHLDQQGAGPVTLHRSAEPPMQHPKSGKYAQVINLQQPTASPAGG